MADSFIKPKSYLLDPAIIGALLLTFANDHYLKYQFPGFVTGKISDFAGLFFFPFFVSALVEIIFYKSFKLEKLVIKHFLIILFMTDLIFILLKYTHLRTVFTELFSYYFFNIRIVPDYSDLIALGGNFAAYKTALKYRANKRENINPNELN